MLRRWYIKVLITILVLFSILAGLHWLVLHNIQSYISEQVASQTNGKFKLTLGEIDVDYFDLWLEVKNSNVEVMDSSLAQQQVVIEIPYLSVELNSLRAMLFGRDLVIETAVCDMPHIIINTKAKKDKSGTVSHELGEVLNTIQSTLSSLQVQKFRIQNGSITLNRNSVETKPLQLTKLNLLIDHFKVDQSTDENSDQVLFSDDIRFNAGPQEIYDEDRINTVSFKSIDISTKSRNVLLDSCHIVGSKENATYDFFFKELRCSNIDYNKLYQENTFKADSILCVGANLKLDIQLEDGLIRQPSEKLTQKTLRGITKNLEMGYVGLMGSEITVVTHDKDGEVTFASKGHELELFDVGTTNGLASPLCMAEIKIKLNKYTTLVEDSSFMVSFDQISIAKKNLSLTNFSVIPTAAYKGRLKNRITIPQVDLQNISIAALLFDKKFKADEVWIKSPKVVIYVEGNKEHKSLLNLIHTAQTSLGLQKVKVTNATLQTYNFNQDREINAKGINFTFRPIDLLQAKDVDQALLSVDWLTVKNISVRMREDYFEAQDIYWKGFQKFSISSGLWKGQENEVSVSGFNVEGLNTEAPGELVISSVRCEDLTMNYHINEDSLKRSAEIPSLERKVIIKTLEVGHCNIKDISSDEFTFSAGLENIHVENFSYESGVGLNVTDLAFEGENIHLNQKDREVRLHKVVFHDEHISRGEELFLQSKTQHDTVRLTVEKLNFNISLVKGLHQKSVILNTLETENTVLVARMHEPHTPEPHHRKDTLPDFTLGSLKMKGLRTNIVQHGNHYINFISRNGDLQLSNLSVKEDVWSLDEGSLNLNEFHVDMDHKHVAVSQHEALRIEVGPWRHKTGNTEALIKTIAFNNLQLRYTPDSGEPLVLSNVQTEVHNLRWKQPSDSSFIYTLISRPDFAFKNTRAETQTSTHQIIVEGLAYSAPSHTLSFNNASYIPIIDRQAFFERKEVQADFMEVRAGQFSLDRFDLANCFRTKTFKAGDLHLYDLVFISTRDKTYPEDNAKYRSLPTETLSKIPFHVELSSFNLHNMNVTYSETSPKTQKEGTISFSRIDARLWNIRNYNLTDKDSLQVQATAYLMDTAKISLRFRESYLDTLHGFYINAQVAPFDLTMMNVMSEPLASIRISSGELISMDMTAIGREYISLGEMHFYYRNLEIELIGNEGETQSKILSSFTNFIANGIFLKNDNTNRKSLIYYERIRHKSIFNYWTKMALSGVMTSLGVRQETIYRRRYKSYLKRNKVPVVKKQ